MGENQHLTQEQTIRLLRAKAHELEGRFKAQVFNQEDHLYLLADVALLFGLLADHLDGQEGTDG